MNSSDVSEFIYIYIERESHVLLRIAPVHDDTSRRRSTSDSFSVNSGWHYSQCLNPEGCLHRPIAVGLQLKSGRIATTTHPGIAAAIGLNSNRNPAKIRPKPESGTIAAAIESNFGYDPDEIQPRSGQNPTAIRPQSGCD